MTDDQLAELVQGSADKYNIPAPVLAGVLYAESNFNANTPPSPKGAIGIAQFMPDTAKSLGIDPTDVTQSVDGAARLLRENADRFDGDLDKAVAAYNWTPDKVAKAVASAGQSWFLALPKETRAHLTKVSKYAYDTAGGDQQPQTTNVSDVGDDPDAYIAQLKATQPQAAADPAFLDRARQEFVDKNVAGRINTARAGAEDQNLRNSRFDALPDEEATAGIAFDAKLNDRLSQPGASKTVPIGQGFDPLRDAAVTTQANSDYADLRNLIEPPEMNAENVAKGLGTGYAMSVYRTWQGLAAQYADVTGNKALLASTLQKVKDADELEAQSTPKDAGDVYHAVGGLVNALPGIGASIINPVLGAGVFALQGEAEGYGHLRAHGASAPVALAGGVAQGTIMAATPLVIQRSVGFLPIQYITQKLGGGWVGQFVGNLVAKDIPIMEAQSLASGLVDAAADPTKTLDQWTEDLPTTIRQAAVSALVFSGAMSAGHAAGKALTSEPRATVADVTAAPDIDTAIAKAWDVTKSANTGDLFALTEARNNLASATDQAREILGTPKNEGATGEANESSSREMLEALGGKLPGEEGKPVEAPTVEAAPVEVTPVEEVKPTTPAVEHARALLESEGPVDPLRVRSAATDLGIEVNPGDTSHDILNKMREAVATSDSATPAAPSLTDLPKVEAKDLPSTNLAEMRAKQNALSIAEQQRLLGKKAWFVDTDLTDGFAFDGDGNVYISTRSTVSPDQVANHEFRHTIRTRLMGLEGGQEINDAINRAMAGDEMKARFIFDRTGEKYETAGPEARQAAVDRFDANHDQNLEEAHADYWGKGLTKESVWDAAFSAIKEKYGDNRAVQIIVRLAEAVRSHLRAYKLAFGEGKTGFGYTDMAANIAEIERAMGNALASHITNRKVLEVEQIRARAELGKQEVAGPTRPVDLSAVPKVKIGSTIEELAKSVMALAPESREKYLTGLSPSTREAVDASMRSMSAESTGFADDRGLMPGQRVEPGQGQGLANSVETMQNSATQAYAGKGLKESAASQQAKKLYGSDRREEQYPIDMHDEFWQKIKAGDTNISGRDLTDVFAMGRRGTTRSGTSLLSDQSTRLDGPQAAGTTFRWFDKLAGFDGYYTFLEPISTSGGARVGFFVVPSELYKGKSAREISDKAIASYFFQKEPDGRYRLDINGVTPGTTAYNELAARGTLEKDKNSDMWRAKFDRRNSTQSVLFQEAARRLALLDGEVPHIYEPGRDSGIRAGSTEERDFPPDKVAARFSERRDTKPVDTDSPEFKRWFGESVVVDSEGRPLVVYHGTARDISVFNPKQAAAIFTTRVPEISHAFSNSSIDWKVEHNDMGDGVGPVTMPLYVRAANPFDYGNPSHVNALVDRIFENAERAGKTYTQGNGDVALIKNGKRTLYDKDALKYGLEDPDGSNWQLIEDTETQRAIKDLGHDGFWVMENGVKNLGVFSPTQIKSAISNTGEFSSENPDIQHSTPRILQKGLDEADKLLTFYKRPPQINDAKRIIGVYQGDIQRYSKRLGDLAKQINAEFPKLDQRAMARWMEAGGDDTVLRKWANSAATPELKEVYEAALNLSGEAKATAAAGRKRLDDGFRVAADNGIIGETAYIENYFAHLGIERPQDPKMKQLLAQVNAGVLKTNPSFAKERIFDTLFELEKAGYRQKKDADTFGFGVVAWEQSLAEALAARQAVKAMLSAKMTDGRPMTYVGGAGEIVENMPGDPNYGKTTFVRPNLTKKEAYDYQAFNHPALRNWTWIGGDEENSVLMHGNMLIHPEAKGQMQALLGKSWFKTFTLPEEVPLIGGRKPFADLMKAQGFLKGTILIGPFHQFHIGEHAVFHGVNPFTAPELNLEHPVMRELVDHGLMVYNHNALAEFGEGLTGGGLFHWVGDMIKRQGGKLPDGTVLRSITNHADFLQQYGEYLFQDYIPRLKAAMAMKAVTRAEGWYAKDLASGKLTREQLLDNVAKQANAAFGELNYTYMGRNKTMQDGLRMLLLAPDFLEARLKFAGQALRPYGREQVKAFAMGAVIMSVLAQSINAAFGDGVDWMHPFTIKIGDFSYTPRSVMGDIGHLISDPRSFWYHRLSPMISRPALEIGTGRDISGNKMGMKDIGKDLLKSWTPIPAQGFFKRSDGVPQSVSILNSILGSIGVSSYKTKTDAERKIAEIHFNRMPLGGFDENQKDKYELKRDLLSDHLDGKLKTRADIQAAAKKEGVTLKPAELDKIMFAGQKTPAATIYQQKHDLSPLTADELKDVWGTMTMDERQKWYSAFALKIGGSKSFDGTQKRELRQMIDADKKTDFTPAWKRPFVDNDRNSRVQAERAGLR